MLRDIKALTVVKALAVTAVVMVLLTLPSLVNPYRLFLVSLVAVYMVAGLGLTIIMGWTGQVVLAQAAFFGMGAYLTAYWHEWMPWPLAAALACLAAAAAGAVIGFPAVRLHGFYLAIATLAFSELVRRGFVELDSITGGIAGTDVEPVQFGGLDVAASQWYLALSVAAFALLVAWRIRVTSLGRCLLAVRDAEVATASVSISAARYKLVAFALSAAMGALAGAVYGQLQAYLTPEIFGVGLLIQFLVVAFVGGVTFLLGPLLGAIFVVVARELLQDLGAGQRLAYAIALILVVRFLPSGLAGLPALWRRFRTRRSAAAPSAPAAGEQPALASSGGDA
ncbi:branched-chain amino acid ABC transporter permease [Sporichthya brevicatena]|uniref:Branched-chain amino acid ABC transporter permease n=1 Tax=Sporichthya brevicatena TaxID=171442 RepID=A0ABN1GAA9_9ACTN